jgi:DNA-binding transcriptional LysR family regulator
VAEHLNFRAAAESLSLTQSAVSRQIQALEDEIGLPLFLRHTRAVELTGSGAQLLRSCTPAIERIDAAVRLARQSAGRKSVAITTWASFASMWLIPRMEAFQRDNPDIDIRIDASDLPVDLDTSDVDLALRYTLPGHRMQGGQRLFGEQLAVVASPWLLKASGTPQTPAEMARFTLIEAGDAHRSAESRMADLAALVRRAGLRPASAQALAVLQLRAPDRAGRAGRPGPGAGAHAADCRRAGIGRLGGSDAGPPARFAARLLAADRPAQQPAARNPGLLRLAGLEAESTRQRHWRHARSGHTGLTLLTLLIQ